MLESKIPKGYKQTVLGVIPEDWLENSIANIFEISGGYAASRADLSIDFQHCYLHYGDIHNSKKPIIDLEKEFYDIPKINLDISKISKKSCLQDGDIVFVDASED